MYIILNCQPSINRRFILECSFKRSDNSDPLDWGSAPEDGTERCLDDLLTVGRQMFIFSNSEKIFQLQVKTPILWCFVLKCTSLENDLPDRLRNSSQLADLCN